jgi:hypothetical protein
MGCKEVVVAQFNAVYYPRIFMERTGEPHEEKSVRIAGTQAEI